MLDHILYAVPDLAKAVSDLEQRLGVRATPGGKHTGLGTHNALLSLSDESYMEVIGPDPDQPPPPMPRPFGIDALTAPGLVTWLAKATKLARQVEQARGQGNELRRHTPIDPVLLDGSRLEGS